MKRIQFEFSDEAMERIDTLKRDRGSPTYAAVVRDALRLLEWAEQVHTGGDEVAVVREGAIVKTVEFLF